MLIFSFISGFSAIASIRVHRKINRFCFGESESADADPSETPWKNLHRVNLGKAASFFNRKSQPVCVRVRVCARACVCAVGVEFSIEIHAG